MNDKRVEAAAKAICLELNGTIFRDADNNEKEEAIFLATTSLAASDAAAWQPIETAPRDGTRVLAWFPHDKGIYPMRWVYDEDIEEMSWLLDDYESAHGMHAFPTHWQPLPAPPSDATP